MKNRVLIIMLIFSSFLAKAQISLENTYAYSTSIAEVSEGESFYYLMDVPLSQCRLYTSTHELYKTINLNIPADYYLSDIQLVSRGLFNSDALIELLYIYEKYVQTGTGYYYEYGLSVVNEAGTSLLSLANGGWAEIKPFNNENKLITYSYTYNPDGYYNVVTNIFKLGGVSTVQSKFSEIKSGLAYPNPASENISIDMSDFSELSDGELDLFLVSGEKVFSTPISGGQTFTMPVSQFSPGNYFYTIREKNKLIGTQKIIIR